MRRKQAFVMLFKIFVYLNTICVLFPRQYHNLPVANCVSTVESAIRHVILMCPNLVSFHDHKGRNWFSYKSVFFHSFVVTLYRLPRMRPFTSTRHVFCFDHVTTTLDFNPLTLAAQSVVMTSQRSCFILVSFRCFSNFFFLCLFIVLIISHFTFVHELTNSY